MSKDMLRRLVFEEIVAEARWKLTRMTRSGDEKERKGAQKLLERYAVGLQA
jgi:hypothetical protein